MFWRLYYTINFRIHVIYKYDTKHRASINWTEKEEAQNINGQINILRIRHANINYVKQKTPKFYVCITERQLEMALTFHPFQIELHSCVRWGLIAVIQATSRRFACEPVKVVLSFQVPWQTYHVEEQWKLVVCREPTIACTYILMFLCTVKFIVAVDLISF